MTALSRWASVGVVAAGVRLGWVVRLARPFVAAVPRAGEGRGAVLPGAASTGSEGDSASVSLALRIEFSRRAPVRVLSVIGEDLRDQVVDLSGGGGATLASLEDAPAFQRAMAMDGAAPNADAGHW